MHKTPKYSCISLAYFKKRRASRKRKILRVNIIIVDPLFTDIENHIPSTLGIIFSIRALSFDRSRLTVYVNIVESTASLDG